MIVATYYIECDGRGPNCQGTFDDHRYNQDVDSIRKRAQKYGWQTPSNGVFYPNCGAKDLCPECQKQNVAVKVDS